MSRCTLRLLSGHSYGGVLVTHALTRRPGLFRAFLAQSPYLAAPIAEPLLVGPHDGLVAFFRERWPLPVELLSGGGSGAFAAHLDRLENELGYPVRYSEGAFQRAAQGLLNGGDVKGAAEAAGLYVDHHPRSPVAHFLRGAALASGGQREAGIEAIEKAITLFDADPDPSQRPLRANMQRVLGQLRGD
ncbi:MAG TPA: hypothetical protein VKA86_15140 [Candidatus Krumholzibacteria bacterium]|nr:hypothetical protein [Candidatus Krumholzibacteria bacterium]